MALLIENGSVVISSATKDNKILQNINLNIEDGKFISIIGHSGCGKTTLLRVMAGLQELSIGKITYTKKGGNIGWVPQSPTLLPNRNVLDNIMLPLSINGIFNKKYATELIKRYGLTKFTKNFPSQISGGMKQKVSILRSLVTKPYLLLMDEPFASIDQYTREIINIDLANKLRSEKVTTVLVTHSIEEAIFLSDEIYVMTPKIPSSIFKKIKVTLPSVRSIKIKNSSEYINQINLLRDILYTLSKNYYEN